MLERVELAHLSQALDLIKLAAANDIKPGEQQLQVLEHPGQAAQTLRVILTDAGVNLKKPGLRIGVSRDEIAKLETGGRKRPKITTLRKLIDALNYARLARGKPTLDIEDLQVPGEVLIPEPREEELMPEWERDLLERKPVTPAHIHDDEGTVEGCPGCFHEETERQKALDAYQETSNEIYYASEDACPMEAVLPSGTWACTYPRDHSGPHSYDGVVLPDDEAARDAISRQQAFDNEVTWDDEANPVITDAEPPSSPGGSGGGLTEREEAG